jgi:hypothetical protein
MMESMILLCRLFTSPTRQPATHRLRTEDQIPCLSYNQQDLVCLTINRRMSIKDHLSKTITGERKSRREE